MCISQFDVVLFLLLLLVLKQMPKQFFFFKGNIYLSSCLQEFQSMVGGSIFFSWT